MGACGGWPAGAGASRVPSGCRGVAMAGAGASRVFDPLGADNTMRVCGFRGFAGLTRGYRVVRPPWGR